MNGKEIERKPYVAYSYDSKNPDNFKVEHIDSDDKPLNFVEIGRNEVGGKIRYDFKFRLVSNPSDFNVLQDAQYTKYQLDRLLLDKKVEDKVAFFKRESLENDE